MLIDWSTSRWPWSRSSSAHELPGDVLHDDEVLVVAGVEAEIEHLDDVGVHEARRGQRLAAEARDERRIVGQVLGEQLDARRSARAGCRRRDGRSTSRRRRGGLRSGICPAIVVVPVIVRCRRCPTCRSRRARRPPFVVVEVPGGPGLVAVPGWVAVLEVGGGRRVGDRRGRRRGRWSSSWSCSSTWW